jgi:gallate decarboxylase subunit D
MEYSLTQGKGRIQVNLQASYLGEDLVVTIFNEAAHIGAVAVGEFDFEHNRASVSVVTRLGHKDDALAQKAAYLVSKNTRRPVCVLAGVHLDNITQEEISALLQNTTLLLENFIQQLPSSPAAGTPHN